MTATNIDKMIGDLEAAKMHVQKVFERDPTNYLPNLNVPVGSMRHHKYVVNIFNKHHISDIALTLHTMLHRNVINLIGEELERFLRSLHHQRILGSKNKFANIHIDIFCPVNAEDFSKYEAPFSNLDFECNGLIYTATGVHLSRSICGQGVQMPLDNFQKLAKIIDDIDNRIAKVVSFDVSSSRINKMINKEWNIEGDQFKIVDIRSRNCSRNREAVWTVEDAAEDAAEGASASYCLICHDDFTVINPAYKMYCCNANYHLRCLIQTCKEGISAIYRTGNCVMCRKPANIVVELPLLEKVCDLKSVYTTFVINRRQIPHYTPRRTRGHYSSRRAILAAAEIPQPIPLPLFIEDEDDDDD
jgi:hypothetical protein